MQNPFVWGANGQKMTPRQVSRLRDRSEASLESGIDASPVGHWSEGLARVMDAYGGTRGLQRADAMEAQGLQAADKAISPVVQALIPKTSLSPAPGPAVQPPSAQFSPLGGVFGLRNIFGR